jgi:hypothetical protein
MSARAVTLLGWALLAAAFVVLEARAIVRGGRFASLGDAVEVVLRSWIGRGIVLLGWLWLGWHVFVR